MERWLRHPKYRPMAECPEGWTHPLTQQFKPIPGTLKPDDESLKFIGELLDKYPVSYTHPPLPTNRKVEI